VIDDDLLQRIVRRLATALAPPAGPLWPFRVDGQIVGELDPGRATRLGRFADVFTVAAQQVRFAPRLADAAARTAALARVARTLSDEGCLTAWRDERYAVGTAPGGEPLFLLERAAARYFGIRTFAVHVNGTTRRGGDVAMWIARRSPHKAIDAGMLDNLVGGGVAAGTSVAATLVKEAWEEAGLPPEVARTARPAGSVEIRRAQPDGLHLETIFVHDLELPPGVAPANRDGEVVEFRLETPDAVAQLIANASGADTVTADASLVIADWLMRHGRVNANAPSWSGLDRLRRVPGDSPRPDGR
jgi:8-oxo-dGTP pyrophosphatase MutT (NUDIX family)